MATIASLAVSVTANTAAFERNIGRAGKDLKQFGDQVGGVITKLARFGAVGAVAAGGAITALTSKAFTSIDSIQKFADRIGIASDRLVGMQLAANLTGVASGQLNLGLQRMTRRIAEAATGSGEAVGALKELGLSASGLSKLTPDKQFEKLAGTMSKVKTEGDKVRLSFKLFDSEGVALKNTLTSVAENGLDSFVEEAKKTGLAFSEPGARMVEQANDSMTRVANIFVGAGRVLAEIMAPFVDHAAQSFINLADDGEGAAKRIETSVTDTVTSITELIDKVNELRGDANIQLVGGAFEFANKSAGVLNTGADFLGMDKAPMFLDSFQFHAQKKRDAAFALGQSQLESGQRGDTQNSVADFVAKVNNDNKAPPANEIVKLERSSGRQVEILQSIDRRLSTGVGAVAQ